MKISFVLLFTFFQCQLFNFYVKVDSIKFSILSSTVNIYKQIYLVL